MVNWFIVNWFIVNWLVVNQSVHDALWRESLFILALSPAAWKSSRTDVARFDVETGLSPSPSDAGGDAESRVSTGLGTEPWTTCIVFAVVASLRPDKNR